MEQQKDELKDSISTLCEYLKKDEGYFESWRANIAVAFQDEYKYQYDAANSQFLDGEEVIPDIHRVANEAAKNFLNLLISS